MVPNTFGKNYVANEKTQHTPRAQGLGKVGKAYSFFCLKGRELNYFGRWENMQIFHWGEESEESHPHCHFIQFQVWKQVYDYFWAFLSLVISFFCLSMFSIGLLLFGNLILFTFHLHNKWEECPTRKGVRGGVGDVNMNTYTLGNLKVWELLLWRANERSSLKKYK